MSMMLILFALVSGMTLTVSAFLVALEPANIGNVIQTGFYERVFPQLQKCSVSKTMPTH